MKSYKEIIDDALAGECQNKSWCLLRQIVESSKRIDERMIAQLKCVEIHKWNLNKTRRDEISWNDAMKHWVDSGFAQRFADVYNKEDDMVILYRKVVGE